MLEKIAGELGVTKLLGALRGQRSLEDKNYWHWDDVCRRAPPPGLTREQWWLALKMGRALTARPIPLRALSGSQFQFGLVDLISRRLHELDLRCGGEIKGPDGILNTELRDLVHVRSLVEEAISVLRAHARLRLSELVDDVGYET